MLLFALLLFKNIENTENIKTIETIETTKNIYESSSSIDEPFISEESETDNPRDWVSQQKEKSVGFFNNIFSWNRLKH